MIIGIGTDICDIRRIESLLEKFGERFEKKTFTPAEQKRANSCANPGASYAKRFAGKEAVAKALAGKDTGELSWLDVEIVNFPSGKPTVNLYRKAKRRVSDLIGKDTEYQIHLSLSDDYPYATAYAILETT